MSWLGFSNHFLSNQRLHAWSWINRTFSWGIVFLEGNLALSVWAFSFSYFCLVRGEKVASAHDFGWWLKGEDHFKSWFPLFSCLVVTILYCLDIFLVQRPFHIFLLFSSDLFDREFSFFFAFSHFLIGIFLSFFAFSHSLIGDFLSFFAFSHSLIGIFFLFSKFPTWCLWWSWVVVLSCGWICESK